jgi:trans-aconitate methyltransferase
MATWNPAEYARSSAPQKQWAQELLSRLDLNGSQAVSDMLKCGGGMSVFFE